MESFEVRFAPLSELSFLDLLNEVGVYVIWDAQSQKRPSYIGEGDIFARFVEHRKWIAYPVDGYVAAFDGTLQQAKRKAEIVEALLLHVADTTGRWPTQNGAAGKWSKIEKVFDKHGVLKLRFSELDPFVHPKRSREMNPPKMVRVTELDIDHDWSDL